MKNLFVHKADFMSCAKFKENFEDTKRYENSYILSIFFEPNFSDIDLLKNQLEKAVRIYHIDDVSFFGFNNDEVLMVKSLLKSDFPGINSSM